MNPADDPIHHADRATDHATNHATDPAAYHDRLLDHHLHAVFGELDAAALALLREHLRWVEVAGGQTLIEQGEAGDSLYLIVSGRLRAYVRRPDGSQRMVREMARGEVIGEIAMYTDEARSASVVAIRDSVLVRLDKAPFRRLIALSSQVSLALTRQIVRRVLLQIEAARLRHITLARSISASTNSTTRPQVRHTRWS